MATVRLYFKGERAGPKFERSTSKNKAVVLSALRGAANDVVQAFLPEARADIASAGNFGSRWTDGLKAQVTEGGGQIRVSITHSVPYFLVFQRGAVIRAKNPSGLLWIPLSFAKDAQGISARDYPGRLFRVNRKSGAAPLLMRAAPSGGKAQAKYFGKPSVTIPKKFHTIEIARDAARHMQDFYNKRLKRAA